MIFSWWVGGTYSDTKANLRQVGLNWDWPTGLSLAKLNQISCEMFLQDMRLFVYFVWKVYVCGWCVDGVYVCGWV